MYNITEHVLIQSVNYVKLSEDLERTFKRMISYEIFEPYSKLSMIFY